MASVPAGRLAVMNVATPLTSVSMASAPFWSLKVTVPPFGVGPPGDTSLTIAVNVNGCPKTPDAVEALSAVVVAWLIVTVVLAVLGANSAVPP